MAKKIIDNKIPGWRAYYQDIRQYSSLIRMLYIKDLQTRYAQTFTGWALIFFQPLLALVIFSVFFGGFIHLETGKIPYPVFAFSGISIWFTFTAMINSGGNALLQNTDLIRKVYFPRIILLISKLLLVLTDFAVSFVMLLIILFIFGVSPSLRILLLPLPVILVLLTASAIVLWINSLSSKKRDFLHIVPGMINYLIWLTPVFYPVSLIPEPYGEWLYYLNPLATCLELFRWSILGSTMNWVHLLCFVWVVPLFVAGLFLFRKSEQNIADYV